MMNHHACCPASDRRTELHVNLTRARHGPRVFGVLSMPEMRKPVASERTTASQQQPGGTVPWGSPQNPSAGSAGTHTFRHTYRSWLDETGAPMEVQQELMRHASIETTMNDDV
jgi:integrase